MENQKKNLLDNTSNQPSKFSAKNCVERNDESRGTCNVNSDIRYKTKMSKSSLCDRSDAFILVRGRITIAGDAGPEPDPVAPRTEAQLLSARQADDWNKGVISKRCASFTKCISEINNTDADNAKYLDIVMPNYNLIKYSDNYSKTWGRLWQYCRDEAVLGNDYGDIVDFPCNSRSFRLTGKTPNGGNTKNVEIVVPLRYLSNFL